MFRLLTARALFGAAVLLSPLLAAAQTPPPKPKSGGILEFAVDSEPANYDCHANISFAFIHPIAPHYSTLLKFDGDNYPDVKGDLAESWAVSPDKLTYTFKLRRNVLFHDGSKLTASDVKASYERIVRPPEGVVSARQVNYSSIAAIETPDPLTVVFRLKWPEAAMLANFASPWNCIYSAAKLNEDPQFPKTHVLGTGAFTFYEHVPGKHWIGRKFDKYFLPGRPYLDGYRAEFVTGQKVLDGYASGRLQAQFRSFAPAERDELKKQLGDKVAVSESPWIINLTLVFNTRRPPFDDARVRRALSLAIDRWDAADKLSGTTFLKFVGGVLRPGFAMATPEGELTQLPGFSHNIEAARDEARRLLAEAGVRDLRIRLVNRDIPIPYAPAGDFVIKAWRAIGVTASQEQLGTKDWQGALERGDFDTAFDFVGDFYDDPTLQLTKFVSTDLSPVNFSGSSDRFLDALYVGQAVTTDPKKRLRIVREFEKRALTEAYSVPFVWWNRIVVTSSQLRGWTITPSHYINQDLAEVWIDK